MDNPDVQAETAPPAGELERLRRIDAAARRVVLDVSEDRRAVTVDVSAFLELDEAVRSPPPAALAQPADAAGDDLDVATVRNLLQGQIADLADKLQQMTTHRDALRLELDISRAGAREVDRFNAAVAKRAGESRFLDVLRDATARGMGERKGGAS